MLLAHSLHAGAVDRRGYSVARDEAYALLHRARQQLSAPGRTVDPRLLTGPGTAAARLVAEANRWNADLVVVGSRRLTDFGGLVLGSVAHDLVRRSDRPVLLAERCPAADPASARLLAHQGS